MTPPETPSKGDKDVPSIKPERDEVASFRRSDRSETPKQSNFIAILVFVIVLMVIVMGVGGYTLYQVQEQFDRSNLLLEQAQEHIEQLDAQLATTGSDVSTTLQDINAQVAKNFSEIDKLWGVTHRQNTPEIQKNTRALSAFEQRYEKQLQEITNSLATLANQNQTSLTRLKALEASQNEELATEVALLRGMTQDQAVIQEALSRNLNKLNQQMEQTLEAIEAIDQHRLHINQRLIELEKQERQGDSMLPSFNQRLIELEKRAQQDDSAPPS